jgi:PAS domain S-box-containing protein
MWLGLAVLAGVYVAAGKLGLTLAFEHASATAVWPPTGIALAAMLLYGYRVWPVIFVGALLVNATTAGSVWTSLAIAAGNTLEGLLGVWLVRRWAGGRGVFDRPRDIFKFAALAGLLSTTVSATVGVTSLATAGYADWDRFAAIWLTWWLGDVVGALVVTPVLVLWGTDRGVRFTWAEAFEISMVLASVILVGGIVFDGVSFSAASNYPLEFLCIPPLVFAAFRFGQREAATCVALLAGIAIRGTLEGFGPFVRSSPNESLLLLQAFMGTLAIMTLPLAAVVREHARGQVALAHAAAIVASSDDAIIGKTLDGIITTWNEAAARLYGYSASEVTGLSLSIIVPPEMGESELPKILERLRRGERIANYETLRMAKDGRRVDVSVTVSPIRDASGRIVGASSIARDITRRKELEATTRERDTLRSVASLATAAAHEINNPLAVVMGQAQLLIDDIAATRRDRIQEILEAAGRIHAIVARMKHLTRIEMMDGSSNLPEMLDIRKSSETDTGGGSETALAGLQSAARYLVIVAELSRYENLKETFADESADVIRDRRLGERRRRHVPVEGERRHGDRRRHDITTDLQKHGWAIVPNGSPSSASAPSGAMSA